MPTSLNAVPGTTEEVVVPLLEQGNSSGLRVARDAMSPGFYVVFSPEREDPGNDMVFARRDRDDQTAGEHLPLREHRPG